MLWTCIFLTPGVVASDCPFASVDVTHLVSGMPHYLFTRVSTCITAKITIERCISIVAPLKVCPSWYSVYFNIVIVSLSVCLLASYNNTHMMYCGSLKKNNN